MDEAEDPGQSSSQNFESRFPGQSSSSAPLNPGQSPSSSTSESDDTVPQSPEQYYTDNSWDPDNLPTYENINFYDNENRDIFYLDLQEANNILIAAYKEVMRIALEAKTWVEGTPALGSLEEIQQRFRSPLPPGMKVECSVESADILYDPKFVVSTMMDTYRWGSALCNMVNHVSRDAPPGYLQQLCNEDSSYHDLHLVDANFQLPTPFVKNRKLSFLRYKKEISPNTWAIVDVSIDYFIPSLHDPSWEQRCRRRPSGIIIRNLNSFSQVIWIENMEVYEPEDNMFSELFNSNLAFCARRCVNTFSRKMRRDSSMFKNVKVKVDQNAQTALLSLTETMKIDYLECVNEDTSENQWTILSDLLGVRILGNDDKSKLNNYVVVTSFHVQVKPLTVFHFLVNKNLQLQWPNLKDPEEVIRLATYGKSNSLTVHKKEVPQNESTEIHEYLVQEATRDDYCSFVLSSPMTQKEFTDAVSCGKWDGILLQPSGFAIMPYEPSGNGSLVTLAMQKWLDGTGRYQAIANMRNLINTIVEEIKKEVINWNDASS